MSKEYLANNYWGDITLCVLINPLNVVSCPSEHGYNKMRSCAIFPVCEVKRDNGKIVEPDYKVIAKASKLYNKNSKVDLEEFAKSVFEDTNPKYIKTSYSIAREILKIE